MSDFLLERLLKGESSWYLGVRGVKSEKFSVIFKIVGKKTKKKLRKNENFHAKPY